jgi:hypothetical protein
VLCKCVFDVSQTCDLSGEQTYAPAARLLSTVSRFILFSSPRRRHRCLRLLALLSLLFFVSLFRDFAFKTCISACAFCFFFACVCVRSCCTVVISVSHGVLLVGGLPGVDSL